jgi:hypothetical protein
MASIIDERMNRLNEAMVMAERVATGRRNARGSVKIVKKPLAPGGETGNHFWSTAKYKMSSVPRRNEGTA